MGLCMLVKKPMETYRKPLILGPRATNSSEPPHLHAGHKTWMLLTIETYMLFLNISFLRSYCISSNVLNTDYFTKKPYVKSYLLSYNYVDRQQPRINQHWLLVRYWKVYTNWLLNLLSQGLVNHTCMFYKSSIESHLYMGTFMNTID